MKIIMYNFIILFLLFFLVNNNFGLISLPLNEFDITNYLTNTSVTNISQKTIIEPQIPNTYLKTGKIEFMELESIARRLDVVFFVAIPITFYLTMNLLMLKNQYFHLTDPTFLYNGDWTYIYINTITVPIFVAYFDYLYVEKMRKLKEYYSYNNNNILYVCLFEYRF